SGVRRSSARRRAVTGSGWALTTARLPGPASVGKRAGDPGMGKPRPGAGGPAGAAAAGGGRARRAGPAGGAPGPGGRAAGRGGGAGEGGREVEGGGGGVGLGDEQVDEGARAVALAGAGGQLDGAGEALGQVGVLAFDDRREGLGVEAARQGHEQAEEHGG